MSIVWKGVFSAVTTAFKEDDTLDLDLFGKNIVFQKEAGVKGIIIGGSLGEASTITKEEKEILTKHAIKVLGAGYPVIVNISEGATREAVTLAKDALAWGANGLMVLPPMRYKSSEEETVEYVKTIAAATDLPILVYNNPYDYKIEFTLEMFDQLASCPTVQAVKESTRDVTNVARMKNRFGDRYQILCGVDTLTFEELSAGADGLVAGLVDALPEETVAIHNLIKANRHSEALAIYRWFMPLLEFDIKPKLVQYIKLVESYTGIGNEYVRAPRMRLAGKEREEAIATIEERLACRPQLPDYLNLV
ncbi:MULTISPECIES: dihydrodipicolinate synthase family protein [Chitinophagaceae]